MTQSFQVWRCCPGNHFGTDSTARVNDSKCSAFGLGHQKAKTERQQIAVPMRTLKRENRKSAGKEVHLLAIHLEHLHYPFPYSRLLSDRLLTGFKHRITSPGLTDLELSSEERWHWWNASLSYTNGMQRFISIYHFSPPEHVLLFIHTYFA